MKLLTRYYSNKIPCIGDFVLGKVIEINDYGIDVELLEYNGLITYLAFKDASQKRWLKAIKKQLKIGKEYVFNVLEVNEEKNYVNLTKKYQTKDEEETFKNFYRNFRICITIIGNLLRKIDANDDVQHTNYMEKTIWKIKKENVFETFKSIKKDNSLISNFNELTLDEQNILIESVNLHIKDPEFIVRVNIKIISQAIEANTDLQKYLKNIEYTLNTTPYVKAVPIYTIEFRNIAEKDLEKHNENVKNKLQKLEVTKDLHVQLDNEFEIYEM